MTCIRKSLFLYKKVTKLSRKIRLNFLSEIKEDCKILFFGFFDFLYHRRECFEFYELQELNEVRPTKLNMPSFCIMCYDNYTSEVYFRKDILTGAAVFGGFFTGSLQIIDKMVIGIGSKSLSFPLVTCIWQSLISHGFWFYSSFFAFFLLIFLIFNSLIFFPHSFYLHFTKINANMK